MLSVTVFGTFGSLKTKHLHLDENRPRGGRLTETVESLVILESTIVIYTSPVPPILVVSRRDTEDGVITWIGKYQHLPQNAATRSGNYCGIGISLLETSISGDRALKFLQTAASGLLEIYPETQPLSFDINSLTFEALGCARDQLDRLIRSESALDATAGLGFFDNTQTCVLDIPNLDDRTLAAAIDDVQRRTAFRSFNRAVLPTNNQFVEMVRGRIRASILTPDTVDKIERDLAAADNQRPHMQSSAGSRAVAMTAVALSEMQRKEVDVMRSADQASDEVSEAIKRFVRSEITRAINDARGAKRQSLSAEPAGESSRLRTIKTNRLFPYVMITCVMILLAVGAQTMLNWMMSSEVKGDNEAATIARTTAANGATRLPTPAVPPAADTTIKQDTTRSTQDQVLQNIAGIAQKIIDDDIGNIDQANAKQLVRKLTDVKARAATILSQAQQAATNTQQANKAPDTLQQTGTSR